MGAIAVAAADSCGVAARTLAPSAAHCLEAGHALLRSGGMPADHEAHDLVQRAVVRMMGHNEVGKPTREYDVIEIAKVVLQRPRACEKLADLPFLVDGAEQLDLIAQRLESLAQLVPLGVR